VNVLWHASPLPGTRPRLVKTRTRLQIRATYCQRNISRIAAVVSDDFESNRIQSRVRRALDDFRARFCIGIPGQFDARSGQVHQFADKVLPTGLDSRLRSAEVRCLEKNDDDPAASLTSRATCKEEPRVWKSIDVQSTAAASY